MKRVTYIISNINKALAFEWIADGLDPAKVSLSFILLNPGDSELEKYLKSKNMPCERILYRGKKDLPKAFFKIRKLLKKFGTEVVHTHLFDASIIGLIAAKTVGVKKRINTRHHSTFHHVYFKKAVKYDKVINTFATDIIAITLNVKDVLLKMENVPSSKVHLVHHGFPLGEFENVTDNRKDRIVQEYNSKKKNPVVGVISRYIEWKGIQYIMPAFKKLLLTYPNAMLVLANARGEYKPQIQELLSELPQGSFCEISFENDVQALYHFFDIYVHTPIDAQLEAFGQTYVEALASGVPSIFTRSGVANEFIQNGKNALVVPFKDTNAIYEKMIKLLGDKDLQNNLIQNGKNSIKQLFTLKMYLDKLTQLYVS